MTVCGQQLSYANAYYDRGYAKYYKNDWSGALADYKKALELKPGDTDTQKRIDEVKIRMAK